MKISNDNARTFFSLMNQAKVRLTHLGDTGKPYIDRLQAIRETFTPADIEQTFFDQIEKVVTDMAEHFVAPVMNPVKTGEPIPVPRYELLPDADAAIGYLNSACNWLRDHQE